VTGPNGLKGVAWIRASFYRRESGAVRLKVVCVEEASRMGSRGEAGNLFPERRNGHPTVFGEHGHLDVSATERGCLWLDFLDPVALAGVQVYASLSGPAAMKDR
jgi:hypothetical protein